MQLGQIDNIILENKIRRKKLLAPYNPGTGLGSHLERIKIDFFHAKVHYVIYFPKQMYKEMPALHKLKDEGSVEKVVGTDDFLITSAFINDLNNSRFKYDFEFWAYVCAKIQDKETKREIPFVLNRAQRRLLSRLEKMRLNKLPIRVILLKARQWGGSTLVQVYMAWMQLIVKTNWHSAIIADVDDQSRNIRGMYKRLARLYPKQFGTITFIPYEGSTKTKLIKERNCIVGVGSAQEPDSLRSYDFAMLHLSEVGVWKSTPQRSAEDLVQSIRSTVPTIPDSLIVMESTAKGVGNFFHREWQAAKKGTSSYDPVFVPWFEIERYQNPISDYIEFLNWMDTETYAKYLWSAGATLEGIKWYYDTKNGENYDDWRMKSEYPSNDNEAFQSTGRTVFNPEYLINVRKTCCKPEYIGELIADSQTGKDSLKNIKFQDNPKGNLWIWKMPDLKETIAYRYALFGDIGGRTQLADYSVLRVIDRYPMMTGGKPVMVATWHGHCFVPGTKIYTSTGYKNIEDVEIGDLVWTHKNRFRKVVKTYKNEYNGEIISLRSQGNYEIVTCTPEHPFRSNNVIQKISRKKYVYNGKMKYGYLKKEMIGESDWIKANDLKYVAYSKDRQEYTNSPIIINKYNGGKSKDTKREITDLNSFFSILGYYLSEGHIGKRKDQVPDKIVFSFGFHERDTVAKDCYEKLIKLGFKASIIEYPKVGVCRVRVYDTNFAQLVLGLCGEHSWGKFINPAILQYSKELLSILLESYWSGDGSKYITDKTESRTITTVSPILARQIRDILILFGYRPGIYRVIARTTGKNIKSKRSRYNIVWTVSGMKKYSLLQDENNIVYKIKTKTRRPYSGYVYNLKIEEDNSYSTACYIVHNCDQDIFAWIAAQVGTFYGLGLLAIETNSLRTRKATEGDHFITILDEIAPHYSNLFARTDPEKIRMKVPIKWGFHTNSGTKSLIINTLNAALREGSYVEKDERACDEMATLEYKADGSIGAVDGSNDDLAITTAGDVWLALKYMPLPVVSKPFFTDKNIIQSEASFG